MLPITPKMPLSEVESTPIRYHTIACYFFSGKKRYPTTSQAQLALTDITNLKSIFLCHSETALRTLAVLPLATTIFHSGE